MLIYVFVVFGERVVRYMCMHLRHYKQGRAHSALNLMEFYHISSRLAQKQRERERETESLSSVSEYPLSLSLSFFSLQIRFGAFLQWRTRERAKSLVRFVVFFSSPPALVTPSLFSVSSLHFRFLLFLSLKVLLFGCREN